MKLDRYQGYLVPWLPQIIAAYQMGFGPTMIARRLNNDARQPFARADNITYVLRRFGLMRRSEVRQADYAARDEEAWRLRQDGLTLKEIGDHFGVSKQRAHRMIRAAQQRRSAISASPRASPG